MMDLPKKYYLATLGCAKNEVDSEALEINLLNAGLLRTDRINSADLLLVNSCGFINDAKLESIDTALDLHRSRKEGSILVMCGCLPARYNLKEDFGEVDLFLPSGAHGRLVPYLAKLGWAENHVPRTISRVKPEKPYGYLKISEGCDNRCSYCAIPDIKGSLSSRPIDDIISEAEYLCENSVKELVLIAQDTTLYGIDRDGSYRLPQLIDRLAGIKGLEWMRIMYAHPAHLTEEIIEALAAEDKVLKYIDLPLQHINDKILLKMNRKIDGGGIYKLIGKLREAIPDIVLRTTFIVGFPGETDADFKELLDFCEEVRFDNLGLFKYSPEEGTTAYKLKGRVDQEIVEERYLTLLSLQNKISEAKLSSRVGETQRVLIQDIDDGGTRIGRAWYQAPEVDGVTFVENCDSKPGEMVEAIISKANAYDLNAVPLKKE
jgi:ribosomal protein S12 methylthiotransferase